MIAPRRLLESIREASEGLYLVYRREQNFRTQILVGVLVVLLGIWVRLDRGEWLIVLLVISFILTLEIVNSVVEYLLDILRPRLHDQVKVLKHMMAGAVWLASLMAVIVGLIIFLPS